MTNYRIWGLQVASDIDLPFESAGSPHDARPADVAIRRCEVPVHLPGAAETGPTWQIGEGRILLRVPGVARFLMTQGRDLAFEPEEGSSDDNLRIFLLGSGLGALLHQRGSLVLHASAISVDGHAFVFCGASGAGKSSLAAALSAAGHRVIADDISLVNVNAAGRPIVAPDGHRLKLWADTIEALAIGAERDAVRPGIQKYWVDPPGQSSRAAAPLAALYFLGWEEPPLKRGIEPLGLAKGVELLRTCAYRRRLVRILRQEDVWFDKSISMLSACRAFRFIRPWNLAAMNESVAQLQAHWREILP